MRKNLVLTGMMGVGKSTIGKGLAEKLSYSFIDIDEIIEIKEGCSIEQIFKNKNEEYFRNLENDTSLKELKNKNSVISLGGGAFLNKSIRDTVKKTSISFWLDMDIDKLAIRLKHSKKRPLLHNKDLKKTVSKIYLERKGTYSQADYKVKCNLLKPELIINKIIKLYETSRN